MKAFDFRLWHHYSWVLLELSLLIISADATNQGCLRRAPSCSQERFAASRAAQGARSRQVAPLPALPLPWPGTGTWAAHRPGSTGAALEAGGAFGSTRGLHAGWHVHTVSLSPPRSTVQGRHNLEDEGSTKVLLQQAIHIISIQLEKVSCIFASCCVPLQSAVLYQIPLSTFQSPSPPGFGFLSAVLHLRKLLRYLIFWCPGNLALTSGLEWFLIFNTTCC